MIKRVFEKYAWLVFLFLGLLWVVVGFTQAFYPDRVAVNDALRVTDMSWSDLKDSSPEASDLVRFLYGHMGLLKMSWSFLVIAITLTGFRRGEKWAWYTMWLVPIVLVSSGLFNAWFFGGVSHALQSIPIVTISLLVLLLPYRKFFPG